MVYAICRRTKEAIEQHTFPLSSWIPSASINKRPHSEHLEETWPPSLPILSKWRNSACDCMDILHWDANSMAARAGGWEHPIILHLHLSRLLILAPVEHAQVLTTTLAYRAQSRPSDGAKYAQARNHLVQWAICDQHKARLSIIHAG
ncbi:hypothetical protein EV126DRAFT_89396 [Verticillium dahliae]|nr:hypothetical protein EV126DRAFT_89396 [Verticillium dahliae]